MPPFMESDVTLHPVNIGPLCNETHVGEAHCLADRLEQPAWAPCSRGVWDSGGAHTKNIEVSIEMLLAGADARMVTYMFSRLECNLGRIEPPAINGLE